MDTLFVIFRGRRKVRGCTQGSSRQEVNFNWSTRLTRSAATTEDAVWPGRGAAAKACALSRLNSFMALDLCNAAVDEQLDAGDEARCVRGQEDCDLADFIGFTDPAHRDLTCKTIEQPLLVLDRHQP